MKRIGLSLLVAWMGAWAALPAMEDCEGGSTNLNGYHGWTAYGAAITNGAGKCTLSPLSGMSAALWTGDAFSNDQYALATVASGNAYGGPAVRLGGSSTSTITGYGAGPGVTFTDAYLLRFNGDGSNTVLKHDTGLTIADMDIWKITAVGSTINYYQNGVLVDTASDATYGSGSAGIVAAEFTVSSVYDWEGGDVGGGGGPTFPAAILNNPIRCCDFISGDGLMSEPLFFREVNGRIIPMAVKGKTETVAAWRTGGRR